MAKKIVKRRGSQLEVRVRKTRPREVLTPPCPVNCKSPNALHISFFTHTRNRYLDSSSTLVGVEQEATGQKTICVDKRVFFKRYHQLDYYILISQVLESFKVMAYLHDSITSQIMSMGESKYKGGKKVKRKISKGLCVDLTWIQTFLGDRDSVHQLFEEAMEEYGMEPSEKGVHFVL
ncbi:hypothetical protein POM88_045841 [Heracleum sosnowskyi]|uniref:Uncharacterized protein n=1 Tax=Heracleum sosnowskyi TaxID=360622 RepID=A0AAD8M6K1_9APIA|nr:hypothetical protein POM88_045841 [Heracleum sosnowskyi]